MYKHFNHEGGIASPGIIHWPAGLEAEAGSIHHEPAHIIDLMPTAVAIAETEYTGSLPLPGENLVRQINEGSAGERTLYFEHQGNRAVRQGQWKLVALDDEPWELYDFTTDRSEMTDLSAEFPERVYALDQLWNTWAKENNVTPLPRDLGVGYLKPD